MMTELLARLRYLFSRCKRGDFDDELAFHVERSTQRNIAAGVAPEEAHRQAMVEFGGVERTREECYEQRPGWWLGTVAQDVRIAVRGFRRNPVFTLTVLATLTLGIGATAAVFSVVDRILFRPLPYAHDDRLVSVGMVHSLERQEFLFGPFYLDWLDHPTPFEALAAHGTMPHSCDLVENNPAQLDCLNFQAGLLPLLGVSPILGRNFLPEEDRPHGPRVALISYGLWVSHYNRDPGILNREINIDGSLVRVVGVLPENFQFPTLQPADIVLPSALDRAVQHTVNGGFGDPMRAFARLKPGVSIAQAQTMMAPLYEEERREWIPADIRKEIILSIRSLRDREIGDARPIAWILFGSVFSMLMIACANVASLMMARGAVRARDLAVRSALGATHLRLIRQSITEASLLAGAGTISGLALAEGLLRVFLAIAPTGIPFLHRAGLDLRIALFAIFLSLFCGVLFGLLPAWRKPDSIGLAARGTRLSKRAFLRRGLVTGQIATCMILLAGAALLLKSFRNMEEQNLGFQAGGTLAVHVALPRFRYDTDRKEMGFYLRAETALRRLPGILAVGISDSLPPQGGGAFRFADLAVEGKPRPTPGTGGTVAGRTVTPDYFRALSIPVIRGRSFSEADRTSSEKRVILSRLLAARLFPGEDPIGKRVGRNGDWSTVVGVAENVKNGGLVEQEVPELYSLRRSVPGDWGNRIPVAIVDSGLSPKIVAPWVRSEISQLDPTVPVEIETVAQDVSRLADRPRFETALLGFFAFCGLLMAVIGLYGVVAFVAAQRTQEIGVRMALGATRFHILRLIASEGTRLILLGEGVGLLVALSLARLLKSLLYNVGPRDPMTYCAVVLLLAVVALAATLFPARAAMKTEPIAALRHE